jgi:hypothetical protein
MYFFSRQPSFMDSFKRHIVVLTLLAMFAQINGVLACYGIFYLNRKAIAEKLCEKKTKNCCGHCFLKKKIAAASADSHPADTSKPFSKSFDELLDMAQGIEHKVRQFWNVTVSSQKFADCNNYTLRAGALPGIDHPPKA